MIEDLTKEERLEKKELLKELKKVRGGKANSPKLYGKWIKCN